MRMKRRLERLEKRQGSRCPCIPWSVDDAFAEGVEARGRFLTWNEYARTYRSRLLAYWLGR